ncbi:MAG: polysaccharide biosynthesis tyrosine autokinase [Nocardioidaceae bacterium]
MRIARRRWKLIAGCLVVAVAAAALVTFQTTPQYSSSARLFVSTSQTSSDAAYQGSLFSAQRVTSYADLASGQELSRRVIEELGLDMEPSDLSAKISATVVPETVIMEISVTDPDPAQAQRLTQAVAEELTVFVSELETPPGKNNAPIKATVVDPASLPETPVSPQPVRNLGLAGILGLLLGLGAAVLRELLDTTVTSQEDVADATDVSVMGNIAYDAAAAKRPLVTDLGSHAPRVEAFRVLRTNLQFVDVDKDSKVFVVTSSVPEEGKTTTATNLAITLAQAGQEVLLVEADLRRPKISDNLQLETAVGLTTVLVGRIGLEDAVQDYSVENLSVLTSGAIPPNPAELLQSQTMADVLTQMRKLYDVIIVDAPPLLPVTDAALLTAQSDGALVVVRHSKTTRDQLRHSIKRLEAVDGRALGVVLNMVPHRRSSAYGYGDGVGYGYGYGYGPEGGKHNPKLLKRAERREQESYSLDDLGFSYD